MERPHRTSWRRRVTSGQGPQATIVPLGSSVSGLLAVVIGAWAAISATVGPEFGYRPTGAGAWDWTTQNWLLHLIPGAVGALAGLMALQGTRRRRAGTGGGLGLAAVGMMAAGIWLVIGPVVWPTFESAAPFALGVSAARSVLNQLGSSYGPGLLLAILGGMALKAGTARPAVAYGEAPVDLTEAAPATRVAPTEGAGAPVYEGQPVDPSGSTTT